MSPIFYQHCCTVTQSGLQVLPWSLPVYMPWLVGTSEPRQQVEKLDQSGGIPLFGVDLPFFSNLWTLGLMLDCHLSFDDHIINIVRVCQFHIRALRHFPYSSVINKETVNNIKYWIVCSKHVYCNCCLQSDTHIQGGHGFMNNQFTLLISSSTTHHLEHCIPVKRISSLFPCSRRLVFRFAAPRTLNNLQVNPFGCVGFLLLPSSWHGDNFLHICTWHWVYFSMDFSLGYSCFPGWELKLCPYLQYSVSVYTQFLKRRTRKFNFCFYVLNLV